MRVRMRRRATDHLLFPGWLAGQSRVDLFVKGDAKAIVLDPGDRTADSSNIAKFDRKTITALHTQVAFAHHPSIGEIAYANAMRLARLLNLDAGEQEQAVA